MKSRFAKLGALAVMLFSVATCSAALAEQKVGSTPSSDATRTAVVVFAAASLKTALDVIGANWSAATGKRVTFSYGSSSAIAKQIEQGAPADVFVSADLKWMDYLAAKKLVADKTRANLLGNRLVLIAPAGSTLTLKITKDFALSAALGDGKLATGDPKFVPAGAYAEAALKSLGVWDAVAPKVVGAENVRAALAFVARREASLGIVYATDAKSEPLVRVIDTFPEGAHPPIVYPFAVTTASKNTAAKEFLAYLGSTEAKAIFTGQGFLILK